MMFHVKHKLKSKIQFNNFTFIKIGSLFHVEQTASFYKRLNLKNATFQYRTD